MKVVSFFLPIVLSCGSNTLFANASPYIVAPKEKNRDTDIEANSFKQTLLQTNFVHNNDDTQRDLMLTCTGPDDNIYYFDVTISIIPDSFAGLCTSADQVYLGNDINHLLLQYGVGDAGLDDNAVFLAGVCPEPKSEYAAEESLMQRRRLRFLPGGFVFFGGGGCRVCISDNFDHRKLLRGGLTSNSTTIRDLQIANWFTSTFVPETTATLEAAILNELVPQHQLCLGFAPTIQVNFEEVMLQDLDISCDDGNPIQSLQSLSLSETAIVRKVGCDDCAKIDFSIRGDGQPVTKTSYVSEEWKARYGLKITASGGYTPNQMARVFDTTDVQCMEETGDQDFRSDVVGNILIIQKYRRRCPEVNESGGTLIFRWDKPVVLSDIGLMDIDEKDQRVRITYADGFQETFTYKGFGDNAAQRLVISKVNVKKLEVIFTGSGAVSELNFCPFCMTEVSPTDDSTCIFTNDKTLIEPEEVIAFDDFEGSSNTALTGWTGGRLDSSNTANFTTFLGRYSAGMSAPYKTYNIPKRALGVIIELDFYEIDSWDYNDGDSASIFVDGELIDLGIFRHLTDEGHREEITPLGLSWTLDTITTPANLGYSKYLDQKHRVSITVPRTSGLFDDDRLRLSLNQNVSSATDNESAGWDNVKLVARLGCKNKQMGSMATRSKLFEEITGAFEVVAIARIDDLTTKWQTIFDYGIGTNARVYLANRGSSTIMRFFVMRDGKPDVLETEEGAITLGELATWRAGVDPDGLMWIEKNGNRLATMTGSLPRRVYRNRKEVGVVLTADISGPMSRMKMFRGAVLGFAVINRGEQGTGKFLNVPQQVTGAFTAHVVASFAHLNGLRQTIFDFSNGQGKDNIRFGQHERTSDMQLEIWRDGIQYSLIASNAIVAGERATWRTGVDAMGAMWIEKDGDRIASKQGVVPSNVNRTQNNVGFSSWSHDTPLQGSVLGLRVKTGSQVFGEITGPFELSVTARFDDLNRKWQRIFDFGRGEAMDNILLGQYNDTNDLIFQIFGEDNSTVSIIASNAIVVDEIANWTVGVTADGLMWMNKNGVRVAQPVRAGIVPRNVYRTQKKIGQSNWNSDDDLDGAVLGLQIKNLGENSDDGDLLNRPQQINGSFNVSVLVRFDKTAKDFGWQRVFDLSNGSSRPGHYKDLIYFGQREDSQDMVLLVYRDGLGSKRFEVIARNAIVLGEMATWETGVDSSGLLWISKNGILLATKQGAVPATVVRTMIGIGEDGSRPGRSRISGAVLGLRLKV